MPSALPVNLEAALHKYSSDFKNTPVMTVYDGLDRKNITTLTYGKLFSVSASFYLSAVA